MQAVDLAVLAALAVADVAHGEAAALPNQVIVVLRADLAVFETQAVRIPEQAARSDAVVPCAVGVAAGGDVHQQLAAIVSLPGGDIVTEVLVSHRIPRVGRVVGAVIAAAAAAGGQPQRQQQRQQKAQVMLLHGVPFFLPVSPAAHSNRSRR